MITAQLLTRQLLRSFYGNDDQYKVKKTNPEGRLAINVFTTATDLGLFLFDDCNNKVPVGCVAATIGGNSKNAFIIEPEGANWPTGTYYLSVDSECDPFRYNPDVHLRTFRLFYRR